MAAMQMTCHSYGRGLCQSVSVTLSVTLLYFAQARIMKSSLYALLRTQLSEFLRCFRNSKEVTRSRALNERGRENCRFSSCNAETVQDRTKVAIGH